MSQLNERTLQIVREEFCAARQAILAKGVPAESIAPALTALTQLRLLRPEQEIVLVQRSEDPISVQETLLADLSQVWLSIPEIPGHMLRMAPIPVI